MRKVIVAGCRHFDYASTAFPTMKKHLLQLYPANQDNIEIVSGGAKGADTIGEGFAKACGHDLVIFLANWEKYKKAAGHIRNSKMAKYADELVAFWDGKSRGTKNMIETMTKLGKPVRVIKIDSE